MKRIIGKTLALFAIVLIFAGCGDDGKNVETLKIGDKEYKVVRIDDQVWMKKNLDVDVKGSKCYESKEENCQKYGRLYSWVAAMNLPDSCVNRSCESLTPYPHKGICPDGFHVPTRDELQVLIHVTNENLHDNSWFQGGDSVGFSLLPAGQYYSDSNKFEMLGEATYLWSSSEHEPKELRKNYGVSREVLILSATSGRGPRVHFGYKHNNGYSVRCMKNPD